MYKIKTGGKSGSALVMALITALVLTILVGALYMIFSANVASYEWHKEDIQAMYTAESGARLATYIILQGIDLPTDSTEQFLPPSGSTWFDLPGENLGETLVYVDPHQKNVEITAANAYGVRALGRIVIEEDAYTYGMETLMMPENFSRFSCFQNLGFTNGLYIDGYRFDGPFHSNGPICLRSSSVGSENDPYFYSLSLARRTGGDGYWLGTPGGGGTLQTTPEAGNLQIQPYERMLMGPPYFDMHADSIPYGPGVVNWQSAYNAAVNGGLYFGPGELPDGTRILIAHDTLMIKTGNAMPEMIFPCDTLDNPVVWIDNNASDRIYLRQHVPSSDRGLDIPLTIGMNGHLYAAGPHEYYNQDVMDPANDDMLGLITVYGDVVIALDPDDDPYPEWDEPYEIMTDSSFPFHAIIMALDGDVHAQSPSYPTGGPSQFEIMGGYIAQREGHTSTSSSGFEIVISYDTRLMSTNPPYFPSTGQWNLVYWEDRPELDIKTLKEDRY